jgi:DNA-binding NtrC family response regulator
VLVVDDEYSVRNLARATLRRSGFQVALAEDGVKGLEMLGQDPNVSMVILDLTMPELDGLQVLAKIRASRPSLPVLLSSGYTTEAIPPEAMTGHTAFLRKPYMPTELVDAVTALLSGRVSDQRSAS